MTKVKGNLAVEAGERKLYEIKASEQNKSSKLRIAAYIRVSSSSDEQLESFAAQKSHYEQLAVCREDWELVDIYADEGITGTSMEKREDFLRLIADCKRGLIDQVVVKSVSRFARNAKECLLTIRELKALDVSVYFEEQRIDTRIATSEMMTAVFASLAQAESESISKNIRWANQRRMANGRFVAGHAPYGFRWINGALTIEDTEADVIRSVFDWYLEGLSTREIAERLTENNIPTCESKESWYWKTVAYMLTNEKYAGDALYQKSYSTETLPARKRINRGEKSQYLIRNAHPQIVSREKFEKVQKLYEMRGNRNGSHAQERSDFTQKIVCGQCGKYFRRKINSGKTYWVCQNHVEDKTACVIKQIPESEIKRVFIRLHGKLKVHLDILECLKKELRSAREKQFLWSPEIIELNNQIAQILSQNHTLTQLKQQGLVDPDIFIGQSNALAEQLRSLKLQKERLMGASEDDPIGKTVEMINALEHGPEFLEEFDEGLFNELVEKIIVESNDRIRFQLINGLELREYIERTKR